ncbi:penicillin-insensitive murein endopeptidase [Pleionea sp. CnH1-48]|uniref:penicillin-insensitive murein endopeptidase n=1 Tax=Pleionea sp. CnH1-48 TaxID=2954494 RepID=UPI002096F479|nr:penicillin-insensitive murein endopeptidase [Pleionea sp. CnH1-48]MCO7226190.1 penicillin-insensitive murein endopeptidase [Pleionea sp. CnH1-48]
MKYFLLLSIFFCFQAWSKESTCYGSTKKGKLDNGVQLPVSGKNFVSYSSLAHTLGRTYVHSKVHKVFIESYKALEQSYSDKIFKYAETGFENGGRFKPHKTHQNGLSIDFMTPMIDQHGKSQHLPTHIGNKWGYNIELDQNGRYENLTIDYEALAAHLAELDRQSKKHGIKIWRVIFAPKLQPDLFNTQQSDYLKKHLTFSKKPSWVRHDEHYHVDFSIPCKPLKQ